MTQYIDKAALVAEIEEIIADEAESIKSFEHSKNASEVQRSNARIGVLTHLRSFLNTLEVKDVDLEKEVMDWWNAHYSVEGYPFEGHAGHYLENSTVIEIAKHFFELGLKAKGEKQ